MPKISIIMPVYNAEAYLNEAIDSILNQTFSDFEFIIIDDGSADRSADIVRAYSDERIRFYVNEGNMGIAATLNRGLALADGEYIARMDSDDISMVMRFEKQVSFMEEHPEVAVCATGIRLFGSQSGERTFSKSHDQLKIDLIFACCFAHPTVMMRRRVLMEEGYQYEQTFNKMEDYALWLKISRKHHLASIKDILLAYRIHAAQVTQNYSEEFLRQNIALKAIILDELGLLPEFSPDIFQRIRAKVVQRDDKEEYLRLLGAILQRNKTKQIYNQSRLKATLESVMREYLSEMPLKEAMKMANDIGMNGCGYAIGRILKHLPYKVKTKITIWGGAIRLKHKDVTIISNNCWGGFISQKYGLEYRSPTVGLYFLGDDYVKFCARLEHYLRQPIEFIPWESSRWYPAIKDSTPYPIGKLDDIEVYFMHFHSEEEVLEKWERRKSRINPQKVIFKLSQRELCSKSDIEDFMALDVPNKVCFTYEDVPGTIKVPELEGFSGDEQPIVSPYFDDLSFINRMQTGRKGS